MSIYPDSTRRSSDNSRRRGRNKRKGILAKILGPLLVDGVRSPLFATFILLVAGAVFAGIIIASYPGGEDEVGQVPVIQADSSPYKEFPQDVGGMDVPHTDSTIFSVMEGDANQGTGHVENLLAPSDDYEEPVDVAALETAQPAPDEASLEPVLMPENNSTEENAAVADAKSTENTNAMSATERPETLHAAGSSPETIEFVRSVLEKKDEKEKAEATTTANAQEEKASEPVAEAVVKAETKTEPAPVAKETEPKIEPQSIETAAGDSSFTPETGGSYVQISSIKDASAASSEWKKLQGKYDVLGQTQYRVQRADLGDKGVFYRLQAGPMSTASANTVCDKIKAQSGGCFVVK